MQQTSLDNIDLHIIRILARDCRTSYKNIASAVGITPIATKKRINKMVSNGVIRRFATVINPVIFGYEKECILIVKNINKTIAEQEIFKKISLLGDIFLYIKELEAASFVLFVRDESEGKIGILTELLKPAVVQKETAERSRNDLEKEHIYKDSIVTEITPFKNFYVAEDYHKNYYEKHQDAPYCNFVIDPKVRKLLEKYGNDVKPEFK